MYKVTKTDKQIDDLLNKCVDQIEEGTSTANGMTYEEGIKAGIEYVTGDSEDDPMD